MRRADVDLVIGTHRLLSRDVKFWTSACGHREEQRFGVAQRENQVARAT
jgi:transcription-repair coupling factor (superfamily II helicase)